MLRLLRTPIGDEFDEDTGRFLKLMNKVIDEEDQWKIERSYWSKREVEIGQYV